MKRALPLTLLALGAILTGCGDSEVELASVDGEPITLQEFNDYLSTKRTVRAVIQGQIVEVQVAETLGFQALQELTTRKLVLHMAADEGISLSKKVVDDEIDFRKALNPSYLTNMRALGYSMGQIKDEIRFSLAEELLLTRGITVTMAEVDQKIIDSPQLFETPASADVYQVFVLTQEQKDEVDAALNAAEGFKTVATRLNKATEGSRIQLQLNRLTDPIKSIIEDAPIAATTEWVETAGGFKRFYVEQRTEATMMDMTPERKESIRRQMALAYGRQANDLSAELAKRLKSSDVVVSSDHEMLKSTWEKFEDRIEESLESSPDTSTG